MTTLGIEWNEDPLGFVADLEDLVKGSVRASKEVMKKGAKNVMTASQEMCPVDKGNLEKAHQIDTTSSTPDSLTLDVSVGGVVDGVDVDEYATKMHELLAPFGAGTYHLGPLSEAKDASNPGGRPVGGKFLERALDEFEPKIIAELEDLLPGD